MAQTSKITTDHDEIMRWAEKHGGHPARVKGTGRGDDPGMIRIDFPGFSGEGKLEPIGWDSFFEAFDANGLALVLREKDRFNKLISRETAEERETARRPRATARTRAKKTGQSRKQAGGRARATSHTKRGARKQKARSSGSEKRPRAR